MERKEGGGRVNLNLVGGRAGSGLDDATFGRSISGRCSNFYLIAVRVRQRRENVLRRRRRRCFPPSRIGIQEQPVHPEMLTRKSWFEMEAAKNEKLEHCLLKSYGHSTTAMTTSTMRRELCKFQVENDTVVWALGTLGSIDARDAWPASAIRACHPTRRLRSSPCRGSLRCTLRR